MLDPTRTGIWRSPKICDFRWLRTLIINLHMHYLEVFDYDTPTFELGSPISNRVELLYSSPGMNGPPSPGGTSPQVKCFVSSAAPRKRDGPLRVVRSLVSVFPIPYIGACCTPVADQVKAITTCAKQ